MQQESGEDIILFQSLTTELQVSLFEPMLTRCTYRIVSYLHQAPRELADSDNYCAAQNIILSSQYAETKRRENARIRCPAIDPETTRPTKKLAVSN